MSTVLRSCLLMLVVFNVFFVHITEAVDTSYLLPLYLLTFAAPLLWRFQRYLLYRMAWNAALMANFVLLLLDTRASGLRYMLEDGLILAVFCQVHVLNNLGRQQKPDLIFFNSFLIALVTSFFCQDLIYSLVFVGYATLLVAGLHIAATRASGGIPAGRLGPFLWRACQKAVVVLILTGLVFVFWPRDFNREGLVEDRLGKIGAIPEIDFTDEIRLDRNGKALASDDVVMRIHLLEGSADRVSMYWRGATFKHLQLGGWWADSQNQETGYRRSMVLDERWRRRGRGDWVRTERALAARVRVELIRKRGRRIFAPLEVHRMRRLNYDGLIWPLQDSNFAFMPNRYFRREPALYQLDLSASTWNRPPARVGDLSQHKRLLVGTVPPEADALHRQLAGELSQSTAQRSQREVVEHFRQHLAKSFPYLLPGERGAAKNLRAFIRGEGGGHCEYFATTLAMLLRRQEIPCRLVSGYLAHEWGEEGKVLTVRSRHAHAWVEVWDRQRGWMTVDPTPAQSAAEGAHNTWLAKTRSFFSDLWAAATNFDDTARQEAMIWAKKKLIGLRDFCQAHPFGLCLGLLGLLSLSRWWRASRRARVDPAVRGYLRALRRAGLALNSGETPRQLLARAESLDLPPKKLTALAQATARHEWARYR